MPLQKRQEAKCLCLAIKLHMMPQAGMDVMEDGFPCMSAITHGHGLFGAVHLFLHADHSSGSILHAQQQYELSAAVAMAIAVQA